MPLFHSGLRAHTDDAQDNRGFSPYGPAKMLGAMILCLGTAACGGALNSFDDNPPVDPAAAAPADVLDAGGTAAAVAETSVGAMAANTTTKPAASRTSTTSPGTSSGTSSGGTTTTSSGAAGSSGSSASSSSGASSGTSTTTSRPSTTTTTTNTSTSTSTNTNAGTGSSGTGTTTASAPAATTTSGLTLTVAGMRSDMVGAHESTIVGLPPEWSWGSQADPGFGLTGFPAHWSQPAYTFWGIVGPAASGTPNTNSRVQIRNLRADFKRNGQWYRAQWTPSDIDGANYTDYTTNASSRADVRSMGADGQAVKVIHSGGHYHFFPRGRVPFSRDMQALVVAMEVRLIKDDPNGPDDLDQAKIYGVAAGDIYQSMTASWNGTTWVNGHAPIGRFRKISRNWRTITAHLGLSSDGQFAEYIAWASKQ